MEFFSTKYKFSCFKQQLTFVYFLDVKNLYFSVNSGKYSPPVFNKFNLKLYWERAGYAVIWDTWFWCSFYNCWIFLYNHSWKLKHIFIWFKRK